MRHRFHSICPYFAMFPEGFAEQWISTLTKRGDVVLDPFCGRGTTPFQALLMERKAIASDTNPVAYCLTRAKTAAPTYDSVRRRIAELERVYDARDWRRESKRLPPFFRAAYHGTTLAQVLYLRHALAWRRSRVDGLIAALVLGALHGESQRSANYLSNQMPRTISTKPAYSVRFWQERGLDPPNRDAFEILRHQAKYRYETPPPHGDALVLNADMRYLPKLLPLPRSTRCVITSPPYLDVTSFEEDQWLRLWFLGGTPYPTRNLVSPDDRHWTADSYWRLITDMWRSLGQVLGRRSNVVVRIGGREDPERVVRAMLGAASVAQRRVSLISWEAGEIRRRQTGSFRPGSAGLRFELDAHFAVV